MFELIEVRNYDTHHRYGTDWHTDYIIKTDEKLNNIIKEIKNLFNKVASKHLKGKYINWNDFKQEVKDEISKYIYSETRRKPITIPVIISTEIKE